MATPQITLKRKTAVSPDMSRNVVFLWIDKANPLIDQDGNILYTDQLNDAGNPIPQYFEIPVTIQLPTPLPALAADRQTMMNGLLAQALETAKSIASQRAYNIADQTKIRALVKAINDNKGIDYDGDAVVPV